MHIRHLIRFDIMILNEVEYVDLSPNSGVDPRGYTFDGKSPPISNPYM